MSLADAVTDLRRAYDRLIEERDVQVARQNLAALADLDDLMLRVEVSRNAAERALHRLSTSGRPSGPATS